MIKKTRLKIVIVVEAIITTILLIICTSVIVTSYYGLNNETRDLLTRAIERLSDGRPNPPPQSREISAIITNQTVINYDFNFFTEDEATAFIDKVLELDEEYGKIKNITFMRINKGNKIMIAGIDTSIQRDMIKQTVIYMLAFGVSGLILLAYFIWILTKWIMAPISKNMEAQKVFISDASHELKTPITAIIANISVLEGESGINKWSNNVRNQAERLSVLSEELLTLSRLEENKYNERKNINFSQLLNTAVLSFDSIAYEENKELVATIKEDVFVHANEIELNSLIDIFLDNAIKHSVINEKIQVKLYETNKPILSIYNKTNNIEEAEKEKLFNRFYRKDNSRSRATGGSGLGLSIAQKIIDINKWKVTVKIIQNESIEFIITF